MTSPFPGMDPYLEAYWGDVHTKLAAYICDVLNPTLPGDLVARTEAAGKPVTRDLEVWALRINDIGIVAVNGEPFAELGLEVKRNSPLAHTLFLGYSNGCLGYFPTPEAFDEGGMEVVESVRNYLLPSGLTPAWGPAIVRTSLELLAELAPR